ncbi:YqcC family protein [Parendozoicomonas sp. Alg238-R29]|uniref:YqcC family protein n=1 Tax=Parendozoicomonas sp. Alg238-R29 TaxID=2993446 RepID=UPI00248D8402|nr:YqcC family protein [Parendozoicomonas sp. Alg238-R29]
MSADVSALLNDLEKALRSEGHWVATPPSAEALSSHEPFCIDTLSFPQWLQWIYIPRLRAMIEHKSPLPTGSQIQPYAQEAFAAMHIDGVNLFPIIGRLDEAMS